MSFTYSSGVFQTAIFPLDLRASEIVCEPFKRVSPVGFLSQKFWGLISLVQIPGATVADTSDVRHQLPHSFRISARLVSSLPLLLWVATQPAVGFLVRPCPCLSYPSQCGHFILCCGEQLI